jgi:hypothetical protein
MEWWFNFRYRRCMWLISKREWAAFHERENAAVMREVVEFFAENPYPAAPRFPIRR